MFRKNEEKYGVTTSYTPDMEGYTTRLYKLNTPEYREREAKASRIAAEIEKSPTTQVRLDAENGDEEERWVVCACAEGCEWCLLMFAYLVIACLGKV